MDASTGTEITMVDQACQTDLPFVVPSPHIFKSIPLADVRHAVANDHNYATPLSDSPVVPAEQSRGFLAKIFQNPRGRWISPKWTHRIFLKLTANKRKLKMSGFHPTMSDYEKSDVSDLSDYEVDEFSESFYSEDEDFDIKTEIPDDDEEKESTNWLNEDCGDLHQERKFLVFESNLKELFFLYVHCPNCGRNWQKASLKTKGSLATIECLGCCDQPLRWQTQQFISSMAAGNLLFSAGILFTSNDYSNIANFTMATNIQFFSQRNFSSTQKKYIFPIVNKKFAEHQVDIFNEVRNTEVVAGGDGCCDSPGHSAKYGTYSIVNTASSKVLNFSLVQVTEVKNSNAMELEGLKRCLDHLQREKVAIAKLATDRHVQVRVHMKKERPHIKDNFDVWHLAKSVQKKLSKRLNQSPVRH